MNNTAVISGFIGKYPYIFISISLISLVLKGFALWRCAKLDQKYWFVSMLIFNTLGILELIYLTFFSKGYIKMLQNTISKEKRKAKTSKK